MLGIDGKRLGFAESPPLLSIGLQDKSSERHAARSHRSTLGKHLVGGLHRKRYRLPLDHDLLGLGLLSSRPGVHVLRLHTERARSRNGTLAPLQVGHRDLRGLCEHISGGIFDLHAGLQDQRRSKLHFLRRNTERWLARKNRLHPDRNPFFSDLHDLRAPHLLNIGNGLKRRKVEVGAEHIRRGHDEPRTPGDISRRGNGHVIRSRQQVREGVRTVRSRLDPRRSQSDPCSGHRSPGLIPHCPVQGNPGGHHRCTARLNLERQRRSDLLTASTQQQSAA